MLHAQVPQPAAEGGAQLPVAEHLLPATAPHTAPHPPTNTCIRTRQPTHPHLHPHPGQRTCEPSLAAMSAAFRARAKCSVSAARVAPPATPVTARATLPRQANARKARGKRGEANSTAMPAGVSGGQCCVSS